VVVEAKKEPPPRSVPDNVMVQSSKRFEASEPSINPLPSVGITARDTQNWKADGDILGASQRQTTTTAGSYNSDWTGGDEEIWALSVIALRPSAGVHTVTLQHEYIEINQPVQWTGTVDFIAPQTTVALEIPSTATITQILDSDGGNIAFSEVTDPASLDPSIPVVQIADPEVMEEGAQTKLFLIEQPAQTFTIKFETPAPYTEENNQTTADMYHVTVSVKQDSDVHYSDVKSMADLPENLVEAGVDFRLYWMIDGVKTDVTDDPSFAVEFVDTDGNGIVDQMQWMVPQLSQQVFVLEGVIPVSKAKHLDSNRRFVADVFDEITERDGIWTDPIPVGDYIRVQFEKKLTSANDITIYAKSSGVGTIKVYEKNSDVLLASFTNISEDNRYKILLTKLPSAQKTFDLEIVGSPIQFDHIIDPPMSVQAAVNDVDDAAQDWVTGSVGVSTEGVWFPYQFVITGINVDEPIPKLIVSWNFFQNNPNDAIFFDAIGNVLYCLDDGDGDCDATPPGPGTNKASLANGVPRPPIGGGSGEGTWTAYTPTVLNVPISGCSEITDPDPTGTPGVDAPCDKHIVELTGGDDTVPTTTALASSDPSRITYHIELHLAQTPAWINGLESKFGSGEDAEISPLGASVWINNNVLGTDAYDDWTGEYSGAGPASPGAPTKVRVEDCDKAGTQACNTGAIALPIPATDPDVESFVICTC